MRCSGAENLKEKAPNLQITTLLEGLLPQRADIEEKKSFIKAVEDWRRKTALHDIKLPQLTIGSTGSLSEKTSLVLVPLIASTGVIVPKFSEHDFISKNNPVSPLQSIPSFQTSLSLEKMKSQLSRIGGAIFSTPEPINSSFKKIFLSGDMPSLKDKKDLFLCSIIIIILVSNARRAIFDIKVGDNTFTKNVQEARNFARSLKNICHQMNINSSYILSDMNQPLGKAIGPSLELIEVLEILRGRGPWDVLKIALELGTEMLLLAGKFTNRIEAKRDLKRKIARGKALDKFKEIIEAQKGNPRIIDDYSKLPTAKERIKILSHRKGYIQNLKIKRVLFLQKELEFLGKKPTDPIDYGTGFLIHKKIGDWVEKNEVLGEIHFNKIRDSSKVEQEFKEIFIISEAPPDFQPFIIEKNLEKIELYR